MISTFSTSFIDLDYLTKQYKIVHHLVNNYHSYLFFIVGFGYQLPLKMGGLIAKKHSIFLKESDDSISLQNQLHLLIKRPEVLEDVPLSKQFDTLQHIEI